MNCLWTGLHHITTCPSKHSVPYITHICLCCLLGNISYIHNVKSRWNSCIEAQQVHLTHQIASSVQMSLIVSAFLHSNAVSGLWGCWGSEVIECLIEAADGHWGQDTHKGFSKWHVAIQNIQIITSVRGRNRHPTMLPFRLSAIPDVWNQVISLAASWQSLSEEVYFNIILSTNSPPLSWNQSSVSLSTLCIRRRTLPFTQAHLGVRGHGCVQRKDGCWCAWLQLHSTRYKNNPQQPQTCPSLINTKVTKAK